MTATALVSTLQPPVLGLNLAEPVISLDPREALVLENILPKANAAVLRKGYKDHVINLPSKVNTIASFLGNRDEDSRVFAFTDGGAVYDVTFPTDKPEVLQMTEQLDGIWDFTNTSGVAGNFLCMVSPTGGYYTYSKDDGFKKREITGKGKGKKFSAIFNFKDRVWLIEADTCKAYYLAVGAIQGDAEEIDFAAVINQGGTLAYGTAWTFNAGLDIEDYLVLLTTNGEVLVYSGYDPSSVDTFALKGVWFVGQIPAGVRSFVQFGGEVFIVSALGVIPVSKLVNGEIVNGETVTSFKIQPILTDMFNRMKDYFGWEMEMIYNQSFMLLKTPASPSTGTHHYFVMNAQTGAWGTVSGMPMNCTTQVNNRLLFGTEDGKVCVAFVGNTDGQGIDGVDGRPIIGTYMSGYNGYGHDGMHKVFNLVRPIFFGSRPPSVKARIITQMGEPIPSVSAGQTGIKSAKFDIDRWNQCTWAGSMYTFSAWLGVNGMGYFGALALRFTGDAETQYVSSSLTFTKGGIM